MSHTEVKKEYVIETLGNGTEVIVVDFGKMVVLSCFELTVSQINNFIAKAETKFFKAVANE